MDPGVEVEEPVRQGPGWAPRGLDPYAGLYPLAVESHVSRMVALLVPGVTTVTIHARYYAIHTAVALYAHQKSLDWDATQGLLRKAEVVAALATMAEPGDIESVGQPHGYGRLLSVTGEDEVDLVALSTPGAGYTTVPRGFLGVYLGSELEMGMIATQRLQPGPRAAGLTLNGPLGELIGLASRPSLTMHEIRDAGQLSLAQVAGGADGAWMRGIMCATDLDNPSVTDSTRRATARILVRSIQHHPGLSAEDALRQFVAFGDAAIDDPVLSTHDETLTWRGTLLRAYSANSWRRLWAWLVNSIDDLTAPDTLAERLADALPSGTVGQFLDTVPDTQQQHTSLPAEPRRVQGVTAAG